MCGLSGCGDAKNSLPTCGYGNSSYIYNCGDMERDLHDRNRHEHIFVVKKINMDSWIVTFREINLINGVHRASMDKDVSLDFHRARLCQIGELNYEAMEGPENYSVVGVRFKKDGSVKIKKKELKEAYENDYISKKQYKSLISLCKELKERDDDYER